MSQKINARKALAVHAHLEKVHSRLWNFYQGVIAEKSTSATILQSKARANSNKSPEMRVPQRSQYQEQNVDETVQHKVFEAVSEMAILWGCFVSMQEEIISTD